MRRATRTAWAAAIAPLLACGGTDTPPAPPLSREAELQVALDRWAAIPGHEGVSAAVVRPDLSLWIGVAGTAGDRAPLLPEHLVWVASLTKTMTGALILQLADEGRLELDDPLARHLSPPAHVPAAVTLRQLLNHTSGLDNYSASPALGAAVAADSTRVFTPAELLAFLGPPRFAPGTRTEYTNTSFLLLGQVAEAVTGQPVVDLYHQRLWDPLHLDEVFLPGYEPPAGPVAPALGGAGVRVVPLDHLSVLSTGHSAFGLVASARTMARWGHELFTGRVISARMQEQMRTLVPAAGNIPGESGAGLGIRGYAYLGRTQLGHSGGASFGSSLLLHDPAIETTVVVLMNQGQGADHFLLAPTLLEIASRP